MIFQRFLFCINQMDFNIVIFFISLPTYSWGNERAFSTVSPATYNQMSTEQSTEHICKAVLLLLSFALFTTRSPLVIRLFCYPPFFHSLFFVNRPSVIRRQLPHYNQYNKTQ